MSHRAQACEQPQVDLMNLSKAGAGGVVRELVSLGMNRRISGFCSVALLSALALPLHAQDSGFPGVALSAMGLTSQTISRDTRRRPCFEEQDSETGEEREEAAIAKLPEHYRYWLAEDAVYIIAPEERCAYLQLSSNEEWDQFIDQFWTRRLSDAESLQNDYEEEHYRRIVFANENFSTTAGWMTDRGHAYIQFGPPDKIELHRSGERTGRSFEEGPATVEYPYEVWRYRYLEGIGENVELKFVDVAGSGDYRLTAWPEVKNESVLERSQRRGDSAIGDQTEPEPRIEVYVRTMPTGKVDYKDLEAMAVSHIDRKEVSFRYESEYRKATYATTMAKLVIIIPSDQLQPAGTDGESTEAGFKIFGRLAKPSGRVASTFEFSEAGDALRTDAAFAIRQVTVPLDPGVYKLVLIVKDIGSGRTGTEDTSVKVPTFEELAANSKAGTRLERSHREDNFAECWVAARSVMA
jgi:GWxTD domain-containing protein